MIERCKISSIDDTGIRLILIDKENKVTPPVYVAQHVGNLEIGDIVAAIFFNCLSDGIIIAKFGG